jgi:hypothetical protein
MTIEERVAVLEAIEDVRKLFFQYTWALDHGDIDAIVRCFAEDGAFEFGGVRWEGSHAIHNYFEEDSKSHTGMTHYPVNIVVDVKEPTGDPPSPDTAEASATLWDLYNREREGGREGTCLVGYYRLSARRESTGWRIAVLEVITKWIVPVQEWRMMEGFEARPELRS